MPEIKTLADYMKEYYEEGGTLADDMLTFFKEAKTSIPLTAVGAPQPDPYVGYLPGAPQPEPS